MDDEGKIIGLEIIGATEKYNLKQHCPVRFLRVLFHCSKAVIPACF